MRHVSIAPFAALVLSGGAAAQLSLVSTTPTGANDSAAASNATISRDGRYVAYDGMVGTVPCALVKDRQTNAIEVASTTTSGAPAGASETAISADGSCVVFASPSSQIVAGDTNGDADVFVYDRTSASTTRVSVATGGAQADAASGFPSLSSDGRFVAFGSGATNLVAGDTNATNDVFVHDRATGTTQLVSLNVNGVACANGARFARISADGHVVAFASASNDLVLPDTFTGSEVYARDLVAGVTTRVSWSSTGAQAEGDLYGLNNLCGGVSANGRYVAFVGGVGLDAAYPNFDGLYVRDRVAGTTRLASVPANNQLPQFDVEGGSLSDDGRFVVYHAHWRMTPDDVNNASDVYVRDMQLGTTRRVSAELPGQISAAIGGSFRGAIRADGCAVVFDSTSNKLVAGDTDGYSDVLVFEWSQAAPQSYCTAGTSAQGCVPALSSSGVPSGSAGVGFTLAVSGADGQRVALLVYGASGRQSLPWGTTSFACVAPPRQRTGLLSTGGSTGQCDGACSLDWNAFIATHPTALGAPVLSLSPLQAQAFVRDPASPGGSVLSNALEFYACP